MATKQAAPAKSSRGKMYLLDTNVLIHDPKAIFNFVESHIGIPIVVLEELDQFKTENSNRGFCARSVIRTLDQLRKKGSLREGVELDNKGTLQVLFATEQEQCSDLLVPKTPDEQILYLALCMQKRGYDIRLVSKDLNVRVRADALGIMAVDYLKDAVSREAFYTGWTRLQVPAVQLKREFPEGLAEMAKNKELTINQYVLVESQHNEHNYKLFRYLGSDKFKAVMLPKLAWPIVPKNPQQLIALDLLLDDSIQLVTLSGPAGTGKTFLALVAALHKLLVEREFMKVLVSRPVIPLGPDIGYLPGDIQQKLHSWMQPIYDNMDFIVHAASGGASYIVPEERGVEQGERKKDKRQQRERTLPTLDELVHRGKMSLEAITYMRGRSIPYQYIFIDEVQNLTPHEVKTIVSRVGEGSKIVLAGDPYQIDSPYLDFSSNGLMVASERFKGQSLFGTAYLETSERSELSRLAGELL